MPNYRQKNRNRNRNKNRNKQANQHHQNQQQQQQQKTLKTQQQQQKENQEVKEVKSLEDSKPQPVKQVVSIVENVKVKLLKNENESLGNDSTEQSSSTTAATETATATPAINSNDESTNCEIQKVYQNVKELSENTENNTSEEKTTHEMGGKGSKTKDNGEGNHIPDQTIRERYREMQPLRTIMATLEQQEREEALKQQEECNQQEEDHQQAEGNQQEEDHQKTETNIISQQIESEESKLSTSPTSTEAIETLTTQPQQNTEVKVIFHRIELETQDNEMDNMNSNSPQLNISPTPEEIYHVESPINELQSNCISTSSIQIQELSDASLSDTNDNNDNEESQEPQVSEFEDSESEFADADSMTHQSTGGESETTTLYSSFSQDDLRQRRVQKRAALESHFLPQLLSPRYLDCIIEENSDLSESNHSISSTPSTPETGAFPIDARLYRRADARFPKSNLDFSRKHKHGQLPKSPTMPGAICEEPQAIIIETKNIEKSTTKVLTSNQTPTSQTECELLTSATVATASEDAEVVFIDSASSSTSDLLEEYASSDADADADAEADMEDGGNDSNSDVDDDADADTTLSAIYLDTDVSEIMSSYTDRNSSADSTLTSGGSRENTPVNQTNETQLHTCTGEAAIKLNDSGGNDHENFEIPCVNSNNTKDLFSSPCGYHERTHTMPMAKTIEYKTKKNSLESANNINASVNGERAEKAAADAIAGSSNLSAAENVNAKSLLETLEAEMNNVRDVLNSLDELSTSEAPTNPPIVPKRRSNAYRDATAATQQSPPPLPPPPTHFFNDAEINLTHTHNDMNNMNTFQQNQYSDNNQQQQPQQQQQTPNDSYMLSQYISGNACSQTSVPTVPTTATVTASLVRQESADSHCSDSTVHSQCTAINLCASPRNFDIDKFTTTSSSYISDAEKQQSANSVSNTTESPNTIKKLRHLCTETLASMPYGKDVLEELANVAQNISGAQLIDQQYKEQHHHQQSKNMPYPLPDMPKIDNLQLSSPSTTGKIAITPKRPAPPIPSAANTNQNDMTWIGMPTEMDPKLLVCLSPAQRAYIEGQQQSNANQQPDDLLDAHQKYIDRRGYHEYTKEQVRAMNDEKLQEQQILETAAIMKKLRKSLTPPPPPVPPPPVPMKSSETAAKAQNKKKIWTTNSTLNDATIICRNANEQNSAIQNSTTTNSYTVGEQIISSDKNNNNTDNNKHRLLAIIHDDTRTGETSENELPNISTDGQASSLENNSRQTTRVQNSTTRTISSSQQVPFQQGNAQQNVNTSQGSQKMKSVHFPIHQEQQQQASIDALDNKIKNVEGELSRMFPSTGVYNVYDDGQKRYSNIETSSKSSPFCSQLMSTQPKRYSNIETSSYETHKRTENGKVVYDCTGSKHESQTDGDKALVESPKTIMHFPVKADGNYAFSSANLDNQRKQQQQHQQQQQSQQIPSSTSHVENIMSALKLNTKNIANDEAATTTTAPVSAPPQFSTSSNSLFKSVTKKEHKTEDDNCERQTHRSGFTTECFESSEKSSSNTTTNKINRNNTTEYIPQPPPPASGSYEEFRQRAKAAADAIFTGDKHDQRQPSTFNNNSNNNNVDHEKLLKDFDDLSNRLRAELQTGKTQRAEREKSSSLYDLNRMQMQFNKHVQELKRQRHEHMQELEHEIERSMRSRQLKQQQQQQHQQQQQQQQQKQQQQQQHQQTVHAYDIPISIEDGHVPHQENSHQFRRAESMFNLTTTPSSPLQVPQTQRQAPQQRERSYSNQFDGYRSADDWSRYANDLGLSENITRPFAREVEICYQRQRAPRTIRAPRLTVSTNDLYSNYTGVQSYDTHNAYNVRRSHAPMMNVATPMQKTKPQSISCYSVLERDPNPTYISTTSRRGVSPAPVTMSSHPSHNTTQTDHVHFNVSEREMRQRRASLPREIQEKQLKYIQSKEEELKTEFDRLQNERRRLMDEMQRETEVDNSTPQIPAQRHSYRPAPPRRLPTLSEDEVFRQQMAEEWLNKVAEREERRLHKILKISKAHETEHTRQVPVELATGGTSVKPNIESEFLSRVKERRSKLDMPADSDWESSAESHPQPAAGHASESEDIPPIKVYEGKSEANLRQLPKHLREFAKFSNHETEKINGGQRELHEEEEKRQEATDNSYSTASKKTSVMKTVKISRQHPYATATLDGKSSNLSGDQHGRYPYKFSGYQSEPEPNYDSDYSTLKYRTVDKRRLQSVSSATNVRDEKLYGTMPSSINSHQSLHKSQPGRIEDYVTGHSSVSDKEKKEHLDQTKLSPHYTEGNLSRALAKDSGYTSESNLVFRKKELPPGSLLSPIEQKQAYKSLQSGAEPPLLGFRKPAPEKPKESPNRYLESDVNIHFKTPVRHEYKDPIPEAELALRQAEQMQKLYQEERRRKYLQELQDMNSRRHTDNFTPSQKSPIPLNRYDDFPSDLAPKNLLPRTVARALYNFQGQNARELSFRKGDLIYLRRQIDKNWYEGEHNAMIGLLPANYIEIINKEAGRPQAKRPSEGQARAKYNFQAQSGVELSLNKGELVTLTRRVDENWYEGKIANRKGIFPVSYVEVLVDIGAEDNELKTVMSDYSSHNLRPSLDVMRTKINNEFNSITQNGQQPPNGILKGVQHKTEALHVDTSVTPITYRALYKYRPQNSDELELLEGDLVHVLEKCDDGWFVGTSQRTGCFGTFPGNYVERV